MRAPTRKGRVAALIAGALLWAAPVAAEPVIEARVRATGEGVGVRLSVEAPVRRLVFSDPGIVRDDWRVLTPGLRLEEGAITSDAPFDSVDLAVAPDAVEHDHVYAGLSKIGAGWMIYGPALAFEGAEVRLILQAGDGETALPVEAPAKGYAYLGPAAAVSRQGGAAVIVGDTASPELGDRLRGDFFAALDFFTTGLGDAPAGAPMLSVSADSPGPALFRGDVTQGGVVSLRFHGDGWRDRLDQVSAFVWHEAFHLWNGVGLRDGESAPWLHEGGAEYAALVGAAEAGRLDEAAVRAALGRRLNGCRSALGDRPFDTPRLRRGEATYDCGVVMQWLTDLEDRAAGGPGVLALWRGLLSDRTGADGYGVAEFRARLRPGGAALSFMDQGEGRWSALADNLTRFGVRLENRPGDDDLKKAALLHVAAQNCDSGQAAGFVDEASGLRLQGDHCGVLSGGPVIERVEGHDPKTEAAALFDAVQARCAAHQPVRYQTRVGRILEAGCAAALARPDVWIVGLTPTTDAEGAGPGAEALGGEAS